MLYYFFQLLQTWGFPGAGIFEYISFRASLALILSIFIALYFGKKIIYFLQRLQIGESIRDLGLSEQMQKKGTPTMGGVIIILSILVPTLLLTKLSNPYIQIMVLSTLWLGVIGFIDDYIKVVKKNKDGLAGRMKLVGQVGIGFLVGLIMYFHPDISLRQKVQALRVDSATHSLKSETHWLETRALKSTLPFLKNNEFEYADLLFFVENPSKKAVFVVFILLVIFIVTAVSNGANLTDGLDGLAAGTSAVAAIAFSVLAYVSGNYILADYLNIMYIPNSGELVVFIAAFIGATVGFLWYNAYPAQVFMGDTGSLTLGGVLAVFAILIRKEFMIPLICGVFLLENLSVVLQVSYFKYTKKKYGEGRRIFLMSPLHHHFQKKGIPEPKIVARFWIVGILLAVIAVATLKVR